MPGSPGCGIPHNQFVAWEPSVWEQVVPFRETIQHEKKCFVRHKIKNTENHMRKWLNITIRTIVYILDQWPTATTHIYKHTHIYIHLHTCVHTVTRTYIHTHIFIHCDTYILYINHTHIYIYCDTYTYHLCWMDLGTAAQDGTSSQLAVMLVLLHGGLLCGR